jgi:hypothetical protein
MLLAAVAAVLAASVACGRSGSAPPDLAWPAGYTARKADASETGSYEALYRRALGARTVWVYDVTPPPTSPPPTLRVIVMTFARRPPPEGVAVRALSQHIPLMSPRPLVVDGLHLVVNEDDPTFASSAMWEGARRLVTAYGGVVGDAERLVAYRAARAGA